MVLNHAPNRLDLFDGLLYVLAVRERVEDDQRLLRVVQSRQFFTRQEAVLVD